MNKPIFVTASLLLTFFFVQIATISNAQFEGVISFKQKSAKDTLLCNFYVKEPLVKYEEIFTNGSIKRYIVVDITKGESATVYPSRSLVEHKKMPQAPNESTFTIEKKENVKSINGKECQQWIVKNDMSKEMMLFYVYQGDFSFFRKLAPVAVHFSDMFHYYTAVNDNTNHIPLGIKKTNHLWKPIKELNLISINRQPVPISNFDVPKP